MKKSFIHTQTFTIVKNARKLFSEFRRSKIKTTIALKSWGFLLSLIATFVVFYSIKVRIFEKMLSLSKSNILNQTTGFILLFLAVVLITFPIYHFLSPRTIKIDDSSIKKMMKFCETLVNDEVRKKIWLLDHARFNLFTFNDYLEMTFKDDKNTLRLYISKKGEIQFIQTVLFNNESKILFDLMELLKQELKLETACIDFTFSNRNTAIGWKRYQRHSYLLE